MAPQNRGLIKTAQFKASVAEIPIPTIRPTYILVRTIAVALNPTDWQTVDEVPKAGTRYSLLGCDAAGIVVEVGSEVTKDFKVGDRISGMSHGGNDIEPEDGSFAEYILMKGDISLHIPPNISFEEAATLGGGLATVALAMYKSLRLPFLDFPLSTPVSHEPEVENKKTPILIYGGSSATGTLAIQFAKLSGLEVITTSSPRNFDLLKSLGADQVLDYRDPQCGPKINALTSNALHLILDTIATPSSATICASALSSVSSTSNIYVNLMGVPFPRPDVKNIFFLGYTVTGETFEIEGKTWDAVPEDFELAKRFYSLSEKLLEAGLIRAHPVRLMEGGLEGILVGMQELKDGMVSGFKLVYRVGEI